MFSLALVLFWRWFFRQIVCSKGVFSTGTSPSFRENASENATVKFFRCGPTSFITWGGSMAYLTVTKKIRRFTSTWTLSIWVTSVSLPRAMHVHGRGKECEWRRWLVLLLFMLLLVLTFWTWKENTQSDLNKKKKLSSFVIQKSLEGINVTQLCISLWLRPRAIEILTF